MTYIRLLAEKTTAGFTFDSVIQYILYIKVLARFTKLFSKFQRLYFPFGHLFYFLRKRGNDSSIFLAILVMSFEC